eukprot:6363306-Amphidinium_carterae.1
MSAALWITLVIVASSHCAQAGRLAPYIWISSLSSVDTQGGIPTLSTTDVDTQSAERKGPLLRNRAIDEINHFVM